jgi:hypothetical protein
MKKSLRIRGTVLAAGFLAAATLTAQASDSASTKPSPTPAGLGAAAYPTAPTIPSSSLTPANGSRRTPSASGRMMRPTPSAGTTSGVGGVGGVHLPSTLSDCAKEGWRGYSNLRFKDQKSCEEFVRRHRKEMSRTPASGHKSTTPTPGP